MDHLVFAAPDLDQGVSYVETLLGVEMSPGGSHSGFGTRNRLLGFGPDRYMEVVSVDPEQPSPGRARWFGLDTLDAPRLVTWCAAVDDLDLLLDRARAAGIDLGEPMSGSRRREDGTLLTWRMSDPWAERAGGVIPFFIDWGETPHPGTVLFPACSFVRIRAEHPQADRVRDWCAALGLDIDVLQGEDVRLIATLDAPNGVVDVS
ncbi:MAG: VOC family protein [Longimicrobiales bacterium]